MANSCRIDNIWRSVNKFFKKENGSWTEMSSSSIESYVVGNRLVVPRARQRYTLYIEYTPSSSSDQGGSINLSISPSSTGNGNTVVDTPATFTASNSYTTWA